jgi:hypothetical protein
MSLSTLGLFDRSVCEKKERINGMYTLVKNQAQAPGPGGHWKALYKVPMIEEGSRAETGQLNIPCKEEKLNLHIFIPTKCRYVCRADEGPM